MKHAISAINVPSTPTPRPIATAAGTGSSQSARGSRAMRLHPAHVVFLALLLAALASPALAAKAIRSPVAVTIDTGLGTYSTDVPAENMINQSGLYVPYVSGATDFDGYFTNNAQPFAHGNYQDTWQSEIHYTLPVTGYVEIDLGDVYQVNKLAIWNVSLRDVTVLLGTTTSAGGPAENAGQFTLSDGTHSLSYRADIVDLGHDYTARYIRVRIDSTYLYSLSDTYGYAIVGEIAVSAEPVTSTGSTSLLNLSARVRVGGGSESLIGGFVIGGTGTKRMLIRGIGPTLATFNVTGALADPLITLNSGAATLMQSDNWGTEPAAADVASASVSVGAFLLPHDSKDAALVVDLAPGAYTVVMTDASQAGGVGLVEMYDVDPAPTGANLVNISTRCFVGTGDNIAIPGLVIGGTGSKQVLIRAVGPTLADFNVSGVLTNPHLEVKTGSTTVADNDDWATSANVDAIEAASAAVGAFPLTRGSLDAVALLNLAAGSHTVHVSGVGGTTGIALVEIYEVAP